MPHESSFCTVRRRKWWTSEGDLRLPMEKLTIQGRILDHDHTMICNNVALLCTAPSRHAASGSSGLLGTCRHSHNHAISRLECHAVMQKHVTILGVVERIGRSRVLPAVIADRVTRVEQAITGKRDRESRCPVPVVILSAIPV
jgi:hypothetical protein